MIDRKGPKYGFDFLSWKHQRSVTLKYVALNFMFEMESQKAVFLEASQIKAEKAISICFLPRDQRLKMIFCLCA